MRQGKIRRQTRRVRSTKQFLRFTPLFETLEDRRLFATQVFTPSPVQVTAVGDRAVFDVVYTALDNGNSRDDTLKTTGVTLRMHYNSKQITPDIASITGSVFTGATLQDMADGNDLDSNSATDRFVNFLWFDFNGNFPVGTNLPLKLFTADFDSVNNFSGVTSVNFTGLPPVGVQVQSTPAVINFSTAVWQNPVDPLDVNDDGSVAPIDVLIIVNELNTTGPRLLPTERPQDAMFYLDPNGDKHIAPLDALIIINHLSQPGGTEGEGESPLLGTRQPDALDMVQPSSTRSPREVSVIRAAATVSASETISSEDGFRRQPAKADAPNDVPAAPLLGTSRSVELARQRIFAKPIDLRLGDDLLLDEALATILAQTVVT